MEMLNHVRGNQKLQLGVLILISLIGGFGCGGGGSATPGTELLSNPQDIVSGGPETQTQEVVVAGEPNTQNQVVAVIRQKNERLRNGVCWNKRSQLREVNRQRLTNDTNKSCGTVYYQRQLNLLLVGA